MALGSYVPVLQLAAIARAHREEFGADARVAFVLPPGGAAGAYQAGALMALAEHGVRADLLIGVSSGAMNGLGFLLDIITLPPIGGTWPRSRLGRLWRRLGHRQSGSQLLVDKPFVIGWIAGRPHWNRGLASEILNHLPHAGAEWVAAHAGAFRPDLLRALLATSIARACGKADTSPATAGRELVDAWALKRETGGRPPTLIVVATEVQSHGAVSFVLGDSEVTERLFKRHHPVHALGHGALTDGAVIDAFLASAAIPGAFPAVKLPGDRQDLPASRYVDGAVAASELFHLAVDAGATLIISLEVSPLKRYPHQETSRYRHPLSIAADALMTIQERYLRADARGVSSWNWRLRADKAIDHRHVSLYRLTPARQELGMLDFDGHFEDGALTMSLFDGYMRGYGDAGGSHPAAWADYSRWRLRHGDTGCALGLGHHPGFWDATYRATPGVLPLLPETLPVREHAGPAA